MRNACFLQLLARVRGLKKQADQCWRIDGRKESADLPVMCEQQTLCFSFIMGDSNNFESLILQIPRWRGVGRGCAAST